ncbi:ChaN family lipoprotein [Ramlibacter humi]|uniref:Haem-binding uptake Tiki superfamily ChaN domain-containing protein n=1 Tax=Ramlibacter humi TaxID=2530451 RepID=A0A4Z0BVH6_9BURK|nr:ChaN family lipoprotein [Ramlibacter humi]TFZ02045.1 hypothetical protein EZ216_12775 [Ramlibacter humi]
MPHWSPAAFLTTLVLLLAGCAAPLDPADWRGADAVLLGEQHDDPSHQRTHVEAVRRLAADGRLAALALEMADQGGSTAGLPRDASEAQVRAALHWVAEAWPWSAYGPAVMAAVRAGVPVLGANLPRASTRAAMNDTVLDAALDERSMAAQREAVREGHCGLMPEQQLAPMARVQVARDRAMARTIMDAWAPGRTVLLLAGAGHVDPQLGVPRHLPPAMAVRTIALPRDSAASAKDHCAGLREQLQRQR